jgi:hypothetical protein
MKRPLASLAFFAACVLATVSDVRAGEAVSAETKFERRGYEVELGGAGAYVASPTADGLNAFGVGLGGRLGVSFSGVYLGAQVVDYLGNSSGSVSESSLLLGAEVGYGFRVRDVGGGTFTIRPQIGLGYASIARTDTSVDVVTSASSIAGNTTTSGNLYLEPRLMLVYGVGGFFVAGGAGAMILPGVQYDSQTNVTWTTWGGRFELGFRL